MELWKKCKRQFCKGNIEWLVEDGKLQGTCWSCGRPTIRRRVDTTNPAFAELVEAGLAKLGGH